jgi:RNA polymerase sigma factor (sigma-70 family)
MEVKSARSRGAQCRGNQSSPVVSDGVMSALRGQPEDVSVALATDVPLVDTNYFVDNFDEVYAAEVPGLLKLAFVLTGSRQLAEEMVQDAFAKAFSRWSSIDNPGGYLRVAVLNSPRNEFRRRDRARRTEQLLAHLLVDETPSVHRDDELLNAVHRLPAKRRAVVVARFYLGLSERETADLLSLRPGTVKSRLSRGLEQLRLEVTR